MANLSERVQGYGIELVDLKYENFLDWFVHIDSIAPYWKAQPTYILAQVSFLIGALFTLLHAFKNGGRWPFLWFGILLHGLVIECASYWIPDIDNFWHSQTPIIFLGRRLPLHIMVLYPFFNYNASVGVSKLRLPSWAEPFAVGLVTVLIDIPYDIVSVRYLHWTWHDTDPNIGDRHYWVPWNSYYFHACFAASFTFWFHKTRQWICKNKKWERSTFGRELFCTFISAMLGMPGGVLLFIPIYHPLHDLFNIHSEVTFFILFSVFLSIIWSGERYARRNIENVNIISKIPCTSLLLFIHLMYHYATYLYITLFFDPEYEVAVGFKEKIGPCNEFIEVKTIAGTMMKKRRYLCATDYNEDYFDWSCLPGGKPPVDGSYWYTACGTPFSNRAEYIAIISTIWFLGTIVFYNLHFRSFGDINVKTINKVAKKAKKHQ